MRAGVPQPLDRIVEELEPESGSSVSPATIQTYVSQLRKLFAGELREGAGIVHRLPVGTCSSSPPSRSVCHVVQSAVATASGDPDPAASFSVLAEALELWRGPPFYEFVGRERADERARH